MAKQCKVCGKKAFSEYCFQHKRRKAITQRGKRTIEYEKWRNTVARPHLQATKGLKCEWCRKLPPPGKYHDIDHIKPRGSHNHLKMTLSNLRFLCRKCHSNRSQVLYKKLPDDIINMAGEG